MAKLTNETLIPVGLAVSLLGFVWAMATLVQGIRGDIVNAQKQLTEVIPDLRESSVSRAEMESWMSLLRASNPSLSLPPLPDY